MKAKIFFGMLFVFALITFVSVNAETDINNSDINSSLGECQEFGDVGLDYTTYGYVRSPWEGKYDSISDYCVDERTLREYFCDGNGEAGGKMGYTEVPCGLGCSEGVCIQEDNENNSSEPQNETCTPECYCGMKEIEYSICTRSDCSSIQTPCENGCDNVIGKCRTQENPEAMEKVTCQFSNSEEKHNCCFNSRYGGETCCEGISECTIDSFGFRYDVLTWTSDCFGEVKTLLDEADEKIYFNCDPNKCKEIGLRESGNYCSSNNLWEQQKGDDISCENNFECSSNLCIDSQCVDSGLFARIIRWFQKLLG